MKFKTYLSKHHLTMLEFAARTGLNVSTIHRAAHGKVIPSRKTIQVIFEATKGEVTPNDLINYQKGEET